MLVRNKYNITIGACKMDKEKVLGAGFNYSTAGHIVWLGHPVRINTNFKLDETLVADYSYPIPYTNAISFDEPETVINALNLFLVNCTMGYLYEY